MPIGAFVEDAAVSRKTKEEHMSWSAWIAVAIAVLEVIREESD